MAQPETWTYIKVSIAKSGGSNIDFGARIEDIDINEGDRPAKSIPSINGYNALLDEPQEMGEITLRNLKPIHLDTTLAAGGLSQQYIGGTWGTSDPLLTSVTAADASLYRDDFRCVFLMTNDTANTGAAAAVTTAKAGYRFYAVHCRITSLSCSGGAGKPYTETVTLKFCPVSASAVRNYRKEACKDTSGTGMGALIAYAGADLTGTGWA
jgi:hypothetical protein